MMNPPPYLWPPKILKVEVTSSPEEIADGVSGELSAVEVLCAFGTDEEGSRRVWTRMSITG